MTYSRLLLRWSKSTTINITTTENWLQWNGLFYLDTSWDERDVRFIHRQLTTV